MAIMFDEVMHCYLICLLTERKTLQWRTYIVRAVAVFHYKELVPVTSYRLLGSNAIQLHGTLSKKSQLWLQVAVLKNGTYVTSQNF